jgi:hypothetical protein
LLSQREWKSLPFHPCSDPLNSRAVTSYLFPSSFIKYSFCCFSVAHKEFIKNLSMIEARTSVADGCLVGV